ncbi:MAG TPA: hypothetical protein VGJ90_09770 [Methylophilaceae bacterium]|jgi:hypothetical protein
MARSFTVLINQADFPLRASLQAAIKDLHFKLTLEDDYVPFVSAGYLPCTLEGEDAGLMMHFCKLEPPTDKDGSVNLQWSGDPREKITVLIIASALASHFNASVLDENNALISASALLTMTKQTLASIDEVM